MPAWKGVKCCMMQLKREKKMEKMKWMKGIWLAWWWKFSLSRGVKYFFRGKDVIEYHQICLLQNVISVALCNRESSFYWMVMSGCGWPWPGWSSAENRRVSWTHRPLYSWPTPELFLAAWDFSVCYCSSWCSRLSFDYWLHGFQATGFNPVRQTGVGLITFVHWPVWNGWIFCDKISFFAQNFQARVWVFPGRQLFPQGNEPAAKGCRPSQAKSARPFSLVLLWPAASDYFHVLAIRSWIRGKSVHQRAIWRICSTYRVRK